MAYLTLFYQALMGFVSIVLTYVYISFYLQLLMFI
jgi:hypothetical protein